MTRVRTPHWTTLLEAGNNHSIRPFAGWLDGLSHAARLEATRSLGKRQQRLLWERSEGHAALTLADIVPNDHTDGSEIRHLGKNTLPLFSTFEKRFCRLPSAVGALNDVLVGYNYQSNVVSAWFSGPGYFIASEDRSRGEVIIDYREVPSERPTGWPPLRSNDRGFSRWVYGGMVDRLRRVSEHVAIGRANKRGKDLDAWFILCREA